MRIRICERCGEALHEINGHLECRYCGARYDLADEAASFEAMLEAKKQEILANRRRVLWDEVHKKNPSKVAIESAARSVREINAEDTLANFYLLAHEEDHADLIAFLSGEKMNDTVAKEVVRFMLLSVEGEDVLALKTFIENHFKGEEYTEFMTQIESIADDLEEGTYMTSLPRDVFLAYSSKDMDKVTEMTRFLEENEFSVFCALRNLRHGAGAAEKYEIGLKDAIAHCKVFVFLSSVNSRSLKCDALSVEVPYLMDRFPKMARIHYRLDDEPTKAGAAVLLKSFDDGREWCRTKEDLLERIVNALREREKGSEAAPAPAPAPREEPAPQEESFVVLKKGNPDVAYSGTTFLAYKGNARKVRIGDEFTAIERAAFQNAPEVEEIDTGNGVSSLHSFAIDGADHLRRFTVGSALEEIQSGAFARVPSLQVIDIDPDNMNFMVTDGALLSSNRRILYRYPSRRPAKAYKVPVTVSIIDVGAFCGCANLESVVLPDGLTEIGNGAFSKCPMLRDVFIPKSVTRMGKNAFLGSSNLVLRVEAPSFPRDWDGSFAGRCLVQYGSKR
ncbi:MAG: leucine-rich repeat domain-containing protein [Erysipelotrichaceae bacterium]|jgi:uncharacterized Zn finger protein (UPF0148 family)|nr:leucine-rich repeat domain-containing protein [Erysipelotrichaceae bacterium]